jgi:UDP-N-acetylmuramyl tripeptide synthase
MSALLGPKLFVARTVGALSRLRGGGASSAPGKVLMRLEPDAIGSLSSRLNRGSVLISATNGKTTTAAMSARILEEAGISLVHNRTGANMAGGIASTLMDAARPHGAIAGDLGLFEVDEFWLEQLATQLRPRVILLGNLFRDQLDRYGELEAIAERWALSVRGGPASQARLVLNADDPLIADLGRDPGTNPYVGADAIPETDPDLDVGTDPGADGPSAGLNNASNRVLYYGVDDDSLALAGMAHAADAKHCRRCGAPYVFSAIYLGHLGHYHCPNCGQTRPTPAVVATDVTLEGLRAARFTLRTPAGAVPVALPLPGLYNVYNALAAAALATTLDVPLAQIVDGLQSTRAAFGRAETVRLEGRDMQILLIKNPAGANEVLRTLALEPGEHDLLGVLNDKIADGRDVSWIWDADFELLAGQVRRFTCAGTRAAELAVRLKYAGIDPDRIRVVADLPSALHQATADRPSDGSGSPLYALPTYTAMLSLRELLVARGQAQSAWS